MVTYTNADGTTATMFSNWRLCYLIGGIPVLYAIFLAFAMRETAHWYANTGQTEKAIEVLAEFEKKSVGTSTKRDPNAIIIPPRPEKTTPNVLFSKKFIVGTSAIWTVCFVGQFCVYGMNAWLPTWFKSIGYSASDAVALQTWNNVAAIISNCLVGYVSDTMGRKKCLIFAWILCIVVIIACSLFVTPDSFIICAVLMLAFGFALNFAISAIYPLMPEQYPTAIRNTGTAWCQAFARFGGSASSIVLGGIATMAIFQAGGTKLVKRRAHLDYSLRARPHLHARLRARHLREITRYAHQREQWKQRLGHRPIRYHDVHRRHSVRTLHHLSACYSELVEASYRASTHGMRHAPAIPILLHPRRQAAYR